ncbi:Mrp/NBP35 family ATP-binding protein [Enteractinococcus helveticum]|uniref:Mrp/NBP35 family ATP-binding protein n=1 Tax=Enteractinococcus helveticum TaxID=1837282 RepID=UPI0009ECFD03|nr:Mrp/NBP35 family ATP-binding protein [Enteractinococcus helveticum]
MSTTTELYPRGILGPDTAPATDHELAAWRALSDVIDPEIRKPITTLGMVSAVEFSGDDVTVGIRLTIDGCPMQDTIHADVAAAVQPLVDGKVSVRLTTMSPEQRVALQQHLTASRPRNPFGEGTLTQIYAVASGKGGVGKSTITANLAVGLAERGLAVGLIDADIHGFSIPGLLGVTAKPTKVEDLIMPPVAYGVKVMSIGMFLDSDQPVAWRGPMLHRALEQFVTDVYWGDLDVLLIDLPPGTGDIAISTSQLLPNAQLLVITTPEHTAAQVAARAGQLSTQTNQPVTGVIENMGPMRLPDGTVVEVFGSGGGQAVSTRLTEVLDKDVPLLGSIPLDPVLRADSEAGTPSVVTSADTPAGQALNMIVDQLAGTPRGLSGRKLPVTPK